MSLSNGPARSAAYAPPPASLASDLASGPSTAASHGVPGKKLTVLIVNADASYMCEQLSQQLAQVDFIAALPGKALPGRASAAQVLIGFASALSAGLLSQLPNLRWLQALSSGVDGIVPLLTDRPEVTLSSAHGIHGPAVSELALTLMFNLSRGFPSIWDDQRERLWRRRRQPLLSGKTVAILGTGLIAQALAGRCQALGLRTLGISATPREVPGFECTMPRGELAVAAAQADFLVVLAPLDAHTQGIVNRHIFLAMKPSAYFINLARAPICDTPALIEALERGTIAGAALDVFDVEPLPATDPLWDTPNLIITPHIGGESDRYADQVLPVLHDNIMRFLRDGPAQLKNLVARS